VSGRSFRSHHTTLSATLPRVYLDIDCTQVKPLGIPLDGRPETVAVPVTTELKNPHPGYAVLE
jgi:hypothetical protein